MKDDNKKEKIALFRYGIISGLVCMPNPTPKDKAEFFKAAAKKEYQYIDGSIRTFSEDTIRRYYNNYMKTPSMNINEKLAPKTRSDKGQYRVMDSEIVSLIEHYCETYPTLPATQIYNMLIENGDISPKDMCESTVNKKVQMIKAKNLEEHPDKNGYRRYEVNHINDVWCGDSSVLTKVTINGVRHKLYVIAFIDDASRLITGIDVFYNDNSINLIQVMKTAVTQYGKPSKFNFDNGANYRSTITATAIANLGSKVHFNRPYTPTGKAKIERFFRTMKDHWYALIRDTSFHDLDEVKESLATYIQTYNNTVHSSINKTPMTRFFEESQLIIRFEENELDEIFMVKTTRMASKDGVISIGGIDYEVNTKFNGKKVCIQFSPDFKHIYTIDGLGEVEEIKELDKHANSNSIRKHYKLTEDTTNE